MPGSRDIQRSTPEAHSWSALILGYGGGMLIVGTLCWLLIERMYLWALGVGFGVAALIGFLCLLPWSDVNERPPVPPRDRWQ